MRFQLFVLCLLLSGTSYIVCDTCSAEDANSGKPVFHFVGGEQIQIQTFSDDIIEGVLPVQTPAQLVTGDGFISAPGAGTINIKGLSLQEATSLLIEKIKSVQKSKTSPKISIAILALPPRWVYVQGEVAKPQQLELPKDHFLFLSAVFAAAGGVTPNADLTRVQIIHSENVTGSAVEEVVNMSSKENGKMPRGPALAQGDIVVVPLAESFSVLGEVNKAGLFSRGDSKVRSGESLRLSDALAAAGGPKTSSNMHAVKLLRKETNGTRLMVQTFDLEKALSSGDMQQDPVLQDGDKVMVGANNGFVLLGRVKTPGIYYPPGLGGSPLMLSRLIALGGGFDTFAKKSSVIIIHPDGAGKQVVDVKAIVEDGKLELDVPLNPGDIVSVGESKL